MKKNTKSKTIKTGVTSGSHLIVTHNNDGSVDMKWNWDKLLEEVQAATNGKLKTDIVELMDKVSDGVIQMENITKQNIVAVTEAKVKKSRSKK